MAHTQALDYVLDELWWKLRYSRYIYKFFIIFYQYSSDRIRTSINVLGDAFGAGIVHHFSRDHLAAMDAEHKLSHQIFDDHGNSELIVNNI